MKLVVTTFATREEASIAVRTLVEERLAACGSITEGVVSIYRWRDAIEESNEVGVTLKTSDEAVASLIERLSQIHPYEVPEILVLRPEAEAEAYARWVQENTR